jgi:predicted nucleotidyltransferase/biotin operon repressor
MRTEAPLLLPLFRSRSQARLLAHVFLHPNDRRSLNQLAAELGIDPATVQREAERLEQAGILTSERVGNARLIRPNESSPFYPELSGLIFKAFGPRPVLRELLRHLPGVERAFIFGSWARRYAGESGEAPGDIDLLILGEPDRRTLSRLCREASQELGLDVRPTVLAPEEWETDATGFIRSVKDQPLVPLIEDADDRD